MHPTEAVWREMLDGEANALVCRELDHHLGECAACEACVDALVEDASRAAASLQLLEARVPVRSAAAIISRAKGRSTRRWALLAASIALAIVTVAGATIRSGVWQRLVGQSRQHAAVVTRPVTADSAVHNDASSANRIAFTPGDRVEISFDERQAAGDLLILVGADSTVTIVASNTVRYALRSGGVRVSNGGSSASYQITIPDRLPEASIRVGDRVVFYKHDASVSTKAVTDSGGRYRIPFTRKEAATP
jgi:hypothetical protein